MHRFFIPITLAGLALLAIFGFIQAARGQGLTTPNGQIILLRETQGDSVREITAPPGTTNQDAPTISVIDSPAPTCYQPDPDQDICKITWLHMYVNAAPNNMVAMTATINIIGHVMRSSGFFQTEMYVPYAMLGDGIRVPCGTLGAGSHPQLGNAYSWTITARDSAALGAGDYGTLYCPAFIP